MTEKTKAARHCCNNNRAIVHGSEDGHILSRGYLIAALLYASTFGGILLHWAVF